MRTQDFDSGTRARVRVSRKSFSFLNLILIFVGCSSTPEQGQTTFVDNSAQTENYSDVLEHWSQTQKSYNGIMATFQVTATLLSNDVISQQALHESKQYHWGPEQLREIQKKGLDENEKTTTFFLSLYTEKDSVNNLDKSDSVWNLYLKSGDTQLKPTSVKRVYEIPITLASKYPYFNAWSRGYYIKFLIAPSTAVTNPVTLVMAGPLGEANLKFPK